MAVARPRIPLFETRRVVAPLIPEVLERQRAVIESGRYILGPEVEAFEAEFAAHLGRRACVGVANGTDALTIALRALGVGDGDEVIVPALSFFATAEAVANAGAVPVFADIDPATHCVTAETVEPVIGDRTRAIVPVHLFGNVAAMTELNELASTRQLAVLEDAAQAAGAEFEGRRAGAWGTAAAFSFYPSKNLGAFGDAGAIVTDDDAVAETARRLRDHGAVERWVHSDVAYNSRLDELQAAALRVLLPHVDEWARVRRRVAGEYHHAGLGELVRLQATTPGSEHAYHLFVISTPRREELAAALAAEGIEARAYYTMALNRQPAMSRYDPRAPLPNAERLAAEGLALPMGPGLDPGAPSDVVDEIRRVLS